MCRQQEELSRDDEAETWDGPCSPAANRTVQAHLNTDHSLFTHLATMKSSGEVSAASTRLFAGLDLWRQHLLCSMGISA